MTTDYYKQTYNECNRINVVTLSDYLNMLTDEEKEMTSSFDWSFFEPNNCYSNSLFICDFNRIFRRIEETFQYCEGVYYNDNTLYHHAWVYSTKFNMYVELTLDNPKGYYYLSDKLSDEELEHFIDSLWNEDDECVPRFIHNDEPILI